jgi:hypothetical protein
MKDSENIMKRKMKINNNISIEENLSVEIDNLEMLFILKFLNRRIIHNLFLNSWMFPVIKQV